MRAGELRNPWNKRNEDNIIQMAVSRPLWDGARCWVVDMPASHYYKALLERQIMICCMIRPI